ncbi:MAG TPA: SsrA-binding protein SmpB [Phycisphaerales bacterium]|nr:SsrA-binding protein SmpB [Phycisphaerales bacterium]
MAKKSDKSGDDVQIIAENRKARHDYVIEETLECGIVLTGSEIKSVRDKQISIGEGWVRVTENPPTLMLQQVHIGEYKPAGALGHKPVRGRVLLAKKGEILKIARKFSKGTTIVPLKMYFKGGWAKVLIGVGRGAKSHDKREAIKQKDAKREMSRAMSRKF